MNSIRGPASGIAHFYIAFDIPHEIPADFLPRCVASQRQDDAQGTIASPVGMCVAIGVQKKTLSREYQAAS